MMRVFNASRLKGFTKSLTGKFLLVGPKLLERADLVADSVGLKKEIMEDEFFLDDAEDLLGSLSSRIPKPGFVFGALTVGSHVALHKLPPCTVAELYTALQEVEGELSQLDQEVKTEEVIQTEPLH